MELGSNKARKLEPVNENWKYPPAVAGEPRTSAIVEIVIVLSEPCTALLLHQMSNARSGLCIGFPAGGPPVTGARLVQERCDQVPPWQQIRQSRDGNDRTPLVAASCQGFGNTAEILELG